MGRTFLRLKSRHLDWSIALNPSIGLAEAYMDGLIVIEDGTLYDFLDLIVRNTAKVGLDGVKNAFAELASPERHTKILVEPWR
jgi:hypothetical protein